MDGEISSIRSQFKTTPFQLVPVCHTFLLSEFKMISMADLPDVVSHKHTSSCPIDSMPKCINVLLSVVTDDFKIDSVFLSFSQILVICRLFHPVEGNNVYLVTNKTTAMTQNYYFKLIIFLYPGQR